jgi:hypothetical protein
VYDPDDFVIHNRVGSPGRFHTVTDTYEFASGARNGQVRKVVVRFWPGRPNEYEAILCIEGKTPTSKPHRRWAQAKTDLERTLRECQCEVFTIKDPDLA